MSEQMSEQMKKTEDWTAIPGRHLMGDVNDAKKSSETAAAEALARVHARAEVLNNDQEPEAMRWLPIGEDNDRKFYIGTVGTPPPDIDLDLVQPSPAISPRAELLREVESLICGDRNNSYGPPHADFDRTAGILNALGYQKGEGEIEAQDVAIILATVKLSRLMWSPGKRDSWVDLAGYAACGHEAYLLTRDEYAGE